MVTLLALYFIAKLKERKGVMLKGKKSNMMQTLKAN